MNKKLGIGIVVLVAIVVIAMFAGYEKGEPELVITELYWDCSPTYVEEDYIIYALFPVEIHGKIYNAGSGTAHDIEVDYEIVDIYAPTTKPYVWGYDDTVGNIKPGEEKEFEISDSVPVWELKSAKELDWDLIAKIEINKYSAGYHLEIEKDGNWLKRAYEECVIIL